MHPTLFQAGHLQLPTFGVLAAAGLLFALLFSERTARLAALPPDRVWDAGLLAVLAAFVSSRVLLVAAHFAAFRRYPVLLLAVPSLTPGGMLLTGVLVLGYLRYRGLPVLRVLDAWAPCGALLWAFLALGHLLEGSDPGVPTTLPWGVAGAGDDRLQPVALFTAVVALVLTLALLAALRRGASRTAMAGPGFTAGAGLALAGAAQFLLSFLRQPGAEFAGGLDLLQAVGLALVAGGGLMVANAVRQA